ncbi:hypothetical protein [Chlamydia ibidis]|nr:hypothetical protein [Chlamydia ibidis]
MKCEPTDSFNNVLKSADERITSIEQMRISAIRITTYFSYMFLIVGCLMFSTGLAFVIMWAGALGIVLSTLVVSLVLCSSILLLSLSCSCLLGKLVISRV